MLQPITLPYRITDADSETFYIFANTANYVEWRLHLQWSDGVDSDETIIDDRGSPFATARAAPGTEHYFPAFDGSGWSRCEAARC
ncbi:hypothetical protein JK358_33830 [Nocardia sp. 2]|uniref:Uncharacterized protein n=1 Tax=Nocardia acididurans TaxID=2802282 RepID=A0ABS1MFI8_9NOCA|nr:hypothetical protein [Nocardia acididurans]MBL1079398.1 hypothetical protein [Nocardia acididurans]